MIVAEQGDAAAAAAVVVVAAVELELEPAVVAGLELVAAEAAAEGEVVAE